MGLYNLLLNRDNLSHALTLNYRGHDKYRTVPGALVTIAIKIIVLIYTT